MSEKTEQEKWAAKHELKRRADHYGMKYHPIDLTIQIENAGWNVEIAWMKMKQLFGGGYLYLG